MNMKKGAFTLAEVLITLGIIGVVAALTIPTLIQNHKRSEATARLKKFTSSIQQAILFAENEQGTPAFEWSPGADYDTDEKQKNYDASYEYWNHYLAKYIKFVKIEKGVYNSDDEANSKNTKVYFEDGSTVELSLGNCMDTIIDINGDKNPNEMGRDQFLFFIPTQKSNQWERELYKNKSFGAAYLPLYETREKALEGCKDSGRICSTLLQYDNFEFKKDYPYKL